jgi:hypothetical protein
MRGKVRGRDPTASRWIAVHSRRGVAAHANQGIAVQPFWRRAGPRGVLESVAGWTPRHSIGWRRIGWDTSMTRSRFALALAAFAGVDHATTFEPVQAPDPLRADGVCKGVEIASYGSYIYRWPERVHLVFWPLTDASTYWTCDSGLVLPVGPPPEVDPASKDAIVAWLARSGARRDGENEAAWRVRVAEGVASASGKDEGVLLMLARAHAFLSEQGDRDAGRKAREVLLPRIEARLADPTIATGERWEMHAVRALYLRNLGRSDEAKAAEAKLQELLATPLEGDDAKLDGFRDYLNELIAEEKGILPARSDPQ